jgi:hypothetical protein
MLLSPRAGRLLLAAVIAVIPVVSHAAPEVSAYRWDAPANIDEFSSWLGSPVTIASVFHGRDSWSEIEGQDSLLGAWAQWVRNQPGRNLAIAVGMFPSGGSLASCGAGSYDAHWSRLADNLAYHGLHWAYLRLGWAMDAGWDPWGAEPGSGKEASYAGCFRRIVQVMRQAQPANQWKFVLGTATNWNSTSYLEAVWPGDAYVDVVAINFYDHSYAANTYPYPSSCDASCRATRQQNAWNSNSPKLHMMSDFAAAHGKKMAIAEWGVLIRPDGHGGGDNPDFIRKTHEFIVDPANNVAFHTYFNVSIPGDIDARLSGPTASDDPGGATRLPNSASTYQQLFGPASPDDVTFTAPAAGATISGSFNASSGCQVTGAGITQVVFFMDNTQLNTDNSAPWQCALDTRNFANGTHTLRAVASNAAGASTTITRTVNVQNGDAGGPTGVTFTAPAAGATISGSFSDSSGCQVTGTGIVRVVFFMDDTQLNIENLAPWQCKLDTRNFANGTHTLRAVAYNAAGASTTVTRAVNVQNGTAGGPTGVTFTAPAAGATISGSFSASTGCQVTGTGITQVVFFMDNTQLNTDNSAPWQCTLDTRNFANGTHTLRAVAYNSAGASTTVTRTVNVQNGSAGGGTPGTPSISNVSGAVSHGSSVTISGSSFGGKSHAGPMLWDDFDNAASGSVDGRTPLIHQGNLSGYSAWTVSSAGTGAPALVRNSSSPKASSTHHTRAVFNNSSYWSLNLWVPYSNFTTGNELYISFYYRYTKTSAAWGRQTKAWIAYNSAGNDKAYWSNAFGTCQSGDYWFTHSTEPADQFSMNPGLGAQEIDGEWVRFETYLKQSGAGTANGAWHQVVYRPSLGTPQKHVVTLNNYKTRDTSSNWVDWTFGGAYYDNCGSDSLNIDLDEFYMDSQRARVEVCDAPTWSARRRCEIQLPTAWSDTSITATFKKGYLPSSTTAYVYVINAAGSVNAAGFPVTVGP